MNKFDYKKFYDTVGRLNGWDFSRVKATAEGVKWQFYDEVTQRCKPSDLLLDIGTGGGESLLSIADAALLLVGVDLSSSMIQTASRHLEHSNKHNVRFYQMDAEQLEFPNGYFNVVSCRHSPFSAKEIAKVLVNGGVFLTQQVSENDKLNIKQAFGRGQSKDPDGTLKNRYIEELKEAGFSDVQSFEYDATEYFEADEDLLFLLKHTPIVPSFGEYDHDYEILHQFIDNNQTDKGIRTNSKRFMIIAHKSI
ncbi:class I SAM-dependent methyltransferase [Cohnella abietis]|uniref:Methyltransferase n=1 Tax=Cohnella abietis TaxID=2507935 RepID=A0A3T1D024_9BACL|nr:class I SAM-dependent methyltransferase [Cohnella abietis]BBI31428.1 methyltransferase [Cohnella abietis]